MNNTELIQKINIIEQSIQNTKASLKSWANLIDQYHKTLKELTNQLATLKKQLDMKEKRNNNPNNQGGSN